MQSRSSQPSPISAPSRITARSTVLPAPIVTSSAEHHQAADVGALRRRARRARSAPAGSPGRAARRLSSTASQSLPSRARTAVCDVALEDVEGALQVALRRADVEPVALRAGSRRGRRRRAAATPRARSRRCDRAATSSRISRSSTYAPALIRFELDPIGLGLLDELAHRAVLVEDHQPVGAGVGDRYERQRGARAAAPRAGRSGRSGRCR